MPKNEGAGPIDYRNRHPGCLLLVISVTMHDFRTMDEGVQKAQEMQNFVKNMAIMAGLLVLAGTKRLGLTNAFQHQ